MTEVIHYYGQLPLLEWLAVIASVLYVVLAARGNIWCWPAAFVSTAIYTLIFYQVYLWMDSLLQVYYLLMAIYGWYCWRKRKTDAGKASTKSLEITSWSLSFHIKSIVLLAIVSLGLGFFMANYTPSHFPYLDSATTTFSVFATYLVAKKVLENWLYWIVIDLVSIYLYQAKGLYPTVALFVIFVVIATYGYFAWRKQFNPDHNLTLASDA